MSGNIKPKKRSFNKRLLFSNRKTVHNIFNDTEKTSQHAINEKQYYVQ